MKPRPQRHAPCIGARRCVLLLALAPFAPSAGASEPQRVALDEAARRLAGGGFVLMMRHAQTEAGIGDPANFRVEDCSTQRNLSDAGRAQARAVGAALREAGIRVDTVRSSAWCRCRETAELAFGRHEVWPALNSFFDGRPGAQAQTREVEAFAAGWRPPANAMLVTHQVNITAALGTWTAPGEIVVGRWEDARLRTEFSFRPG